MLQLQFVMELLVVVELMVVVVVPAAWETDSGSRDVGVAFDTDGTDSGPVIHNGLVHHRVDHMVAHNVIDHGIVGVRSVVELLKLKITFGTYHQSVILSELITS